MFTCKTPARGCWVYWLFWLQANLLQLLKYLRGDSWRDHFILLFMIIAQTRRQYALHCKRSTSLKMSAITTQKNDFLLPFAGPMWGTVWLGFPRVVCLDFSFYLWLWGTQAALAVDLAMRFSSHLWFWYLRGNLTIAYHSLARLFVEPSFVEMNFKSDARWSSNAIVLISLESEMCPTEVKGHSLESALRILDSTGCKGK